MEMEWARDREDTVWVTAIADHGINGLGINPNKVIQLDPPRVRCGWTLFEKVRRMPVIERREVGGIVCERRRY
eukprot:882247-Prymnesium_polylepis.1